MKNQQHTDEMKKFVFPPDAHVVGS